MAQSKKAENKETKKNQEQDNQPQLEENQQTQTPPSRQAGANQPLHMSESGENQSQGMNRAGQSQQQQGLSRREEFAPLSPFSFMRRFSEEMDRLFEDFGFGGGFLAPGYGSNFQEISMWSPETEVFQRGNELVVRADLPGMTKDDIQVELEDDQIIIQGERRDEREQSEEGYYHTERSYGSFYRSIPLPEGIDADKANANFNNGVLEITMPMPEQKSRKRQLDIGEGGSEKSQQNKKSKSANQ